MDEGGFILDYVMPPGSSLQETDSVIAHVEQIVRQVPEVESTSRRTGLQLGLAAVTEANTGDISVKLKSKRSRGVGDVISEIRAKVKTQEPRARCRFHPGVARHDWRSHWSAATCRREALSPDADLLATWAPRVADALTEVQVSGKHPVVDVADGIENSTSGPAVIFKIDPQTSSKAGFTTDQLTTVASANG